MIKKKSISTLLVIVMLALPLLGGWHGSAADPMFEIPENFDSNAQYEITFWAKNDTNIRQTKVYKKAIEDFQSLYPNIKVNLTLYTDYGKIYEDVIKNIPTKTTPNVCITYPDHIATYKTGINVVVPLEELMADSKYGLGGSSLKFDSPTIEEMIPKFLNEGVIDGVQYALPYMRSTEACYINKTYVEKLGYTIPEVLTWDFVWEVSEAAMAKNEDGTFKVNGQKVLIPFIYKSADNMMIQMLNQSGGGYSKADGTIEIFNETTKAHLNTIAKHVATGAFSTFNVSGYPANYLNAGQCIFAIDSTAGATWMGCEAPLLDISEDKLVKFETAVRMIPQFNTESPSMISQGPSMCIFNKADNGEVMASWLFMQFLLTNDVQIGYAKTEGYVPVTTRAIESEEYKDYISRSGEDNDTYYDVKIKASKLLTDNVDNTFVTPVFNGSASLRTAAGRMIVNVNKSVRRKETIDEAYFKTLFDEMTSLYKLNSSGKLSYDADLGPLPATSIVLLSSIAVAWVAMGAYVVAQKVKKRKNNH